MATQPITLFLCGDVMTGRGIDQLLPHPSEPAIYEPYCRSALDYVALAERAHGPLPRRVDYAYVWGEALDLLDAAGPDLRIINLETAVTRSDAPWPGKGIQYRMHPDNVPCLQAARVDCCVLSNNHVLDWGVAGLHETLEVLRGAGLRTAGAGRDLAEAQAPAVLPVPGRGRVLVLGMAERTSGILFGQEAEPGRAGVYTLPDLSAETARDIGARIQRLRRPGDVVVASIHWGDNWGYPVPPAHRAFAHRLVEEACVDVVHGHSSHHVKGVEVHEGRLVLYGCGDLITDYEGISGHEPYRPELSLLYLPTIDAETGRLVRLRMVPTRLHRFQLHRAGEEEARWLQGVLSREGAPLGTGARLEPGGSLSLQWAGP